MEMVMTKRTLCSFSLAPWLGTCVQKLELKHSVHLVKCRVSEGVLLQSLSKKVIKPNNGSVSIIKGEKVRTVACKSLGAISKFSTQYAQKALDVLMGMMNDDTEAVRLQTL